MARKKNAAEQTDIPGTTEAPTGPFLTAAKAYEAAAEARDEAKLEFKAAKDTLIELMKTKGLTHMKGNGWALERGQKDTLKVTNLNKAADEQD